MKSLTRFAAIALCRSLSLSASFLALANGAGLTTSASVSSQLCSADYSSATINLKIIVTSTASGAPATVTVSNDGGATFKPVGTISVWSQSASGPTKSASLAFSEVLPAGTPTKLEVCAAQLGGNGNPDTSSCANLTINPMCASYIPLATLDYTASGADFLVISDWGNQADITDIMEVASQMNTWASNFNSNFVISLGNNFYEGGVYNYEGVQSAADPKFDALWKNVYSGAALSQLPWWLILGNHDWYAVGSPFYEMQHQDPNWNIPDYFYVQRFALPNSKHATLIFIETDLLFYGYPGKKNMAANFQTAGWSSQANTHLKQLAWIDKALEVANQDDYVLVLGHHPVFTCGSDAQGSVYMSMLGALITKWKPTAYMNGHHNTLASYFTDSTLQIQPGSGGNIDAACAPLTPAPGFEIPNTYGAAHAQLTGSEFRIDFVLETGGSPGGSASLARTPVVGVQADTTFLPPVGDPSIHKQ